MTELRGKPVATALEEQMTEKVGLLKEKGIVPTLLIVRVGERPDDLSYERNATSVGERLGLCVKSASFAADIAENDFLAAFQKAVTDESVHGVLLFRPLPKQLDLQKVKALLPAEKDVDGMLDENLGKLFLDDKTAFPPCTAQAVMELLHFYHIPVSGRHAVVCGRSLVIGKPLSQLLLAENATVTVCHSRTENMPAVTKSADMVITAVGRAKMFTQNYFTEAQTVIDVGINVDEAGALCGDVDAAHVNVSALTPVPGGIGAVTTRVLMLHCVVAAERKATA